MVTNKQIIEITRILSNDDQVEKVILFGSYAHGTANENSDLDLAIIQNTDLSGFQRPIQFLKSLRQNHRRWLFAMDIIVYTPEEFEQNCSNQYHLAHEIALTGKTLYERKQSTKLVA
jgi:uncharacterized protein